VPEVPRTVSGKQRLVVSNLRARVRRLLDIALGTGLVLGAPLIAALGAAVKLDSRGPALFVQTRVGRGQRPFRMVKLRTMTVSGAPNRGPQVTAAGEARITRVEKSAAPEDQARRAAPAVERPARRHEPRRAAARSAALVERYRRSGSRCSACDRG
jgi:hypothetical protein